MVAQNGDRKHTWDSLFVTSERFCLTCANSSLSNCNEWSLMDLSCSTVSVALLICSFNMLNFLEYRVLSISLSTNRFWSSSIFRLRSKAAIYRFFTEIETNRKKKKRLSQSCNLLPCNQRPPSIVRLTLDSSISPPKFAPANDPFASTTSSPWKRTDDPRSIYIYMHTDIEIESNEERRKYGNEHT